MRDAAWRGSKVGDGLDVPLEFIPRTRLTPLGMNHRQTRPFRDCRCACMYEFIHSNTPSLGINSSTCSSCAPWPYQY